MRIVIADDERLVRFTLRSMLEELPLPITSIHEARDGEALRDAVRATEPHLAFVDVQMPRLNGMKAIGSLTEEFPDTTWIILSAHNDFSYAQEAIRLGVFRYLLKPVDPGELEGAVRAVYERTITFSREEIQRESAATAEGKSGYSSLVRRSLAWMAENYRETVGLNEAAVSLGVTASHLSTTFRHQTGQTFLTALTRLRVEKARELIEAGASIGDVALSVGYTSRRHFSRRFREHFGASPSEIRDQK